MSLHLTDDRLYEELQAVYAQVKGLSRPLHGGDRLLDDLDIDSLDAIDILASLEQRLDLTILEEVASRLDDTVTVDDFVGVLREVLDACTT